jgi:hypothetical protein
VAGFHFTPVIMPLLQSATEQDSHALNFKLIALLVAGITVWRTRRFGLSILWTLMRISS